MSPRVVRDVPGFNSSPSLLDHSRAHRDGYRRNKKICLDSRKHSQSTIHILTHFSLYRTSNSRLYRVAGDIGIVLTEIVGGAHPH